MSGLFGTTAGPWHPYPEWEGDYEIVGPVGRREGINYVPKSRPFVTTASTKENQRAIAQVPAMLELVAAVVGASDADDMQDRALELARKIVAELEVE